MFGPSREHWRVEDCFKEGSLVFPYHHKNYKAILHSHDFYEINIISRGKGVHHMGDRTFEARRGDVYVIPPMVRHGYSTGEGMDICHILIKKEFLGRYGDELRDLHGYQTLFEIEPYLRQNTASEYFLHLSGADADALCAEIQLSHEEYVKGNYVFTNINVLDIIAKLCMHFRDRRQREESAEKYSLINTMEYIRNNLDKKLSIDELASMAHVSAATLNRRFRRVLSLSPVQYITGCRVEMARRLMAESNLSKTEIALMCGFYDSSHMNKYIL